MKLSMSNLAWDISEDIKVAELFRNLQVTGVELAPTKIWQEPLSADDETIAEYRAYWEQQGIDISALQSLLFGKPEMVLFGTAEQRQQTLEYLCGVIELAAKLGADALVFGSPKNRQRGEMEWTQAMDLAVEFFTHIAETASLNGVTFCIEPNPKEYGCDFVTNAAEGVDLVSEVNHPGFRLHLDAGAMTLNGEDIDRVLTDSINWLAHFHISEPQLAVIGQGPTPHFRIGRRLKSLGYEKWVSIEMLNKTRDPNPKAVESALARAMEAYL